MKTLAERIAEAEAAVSATTEGTPERARAETRRDALKEADTVHKSVVSGTETAAREAREQEIATALGVSVDEAKRIVKAHQDAEEQSRTEIQRKDQTIAEKETAIETANRERDEALERANKTLVDSKVELALVGAGVDAKRLPKILSDSSLAAAKVENGQVTGVEDFVKAAQTEYPEWFGSQERRQITKTPQGTQETGKAPEDSYIAQTYKWRPGTPS